MLAVVASAAAAVVVAAAACAAMASVAAEMASVAGRTAGCGAGRSAEGGHPRRCWAGRRAGRCRAKGLAQPASGREGRHACEYIYLTLVSTHLSLSLSLSMYM